MKIEYVTKNINIPFYSIVVNWAGEVKPHTMIEELIALGYKDTFGVDPFDKPEITLHPPEGTGNWGTHTICEAQDWYLKSGTVLMAHGITIEDVMVREITKGELL